MENKKKKYTFKGYLTVEASFIVPFILFLYIFLVFTAFFLYSKCLLWQDYYLLSFRGSTLTDWSAGYGETAYGYLSKRKEERTRCYIEQRSVDLIEGGKYPAFQKEEEQIEIDNTEVAILIRGKSRIPFWREKEIKVDVQAAIINPIMVIREERRGRGIDRK